MIKQSTTKIYSDFFGIANLTNRFKSEAAQVNRCKSDNLHRKFGPLLEPRNKPVKQEKEVHLLYGVIRRDDDNYVKIHGQYDRNDTKLEPEKIRELYLENDEHKVDQTIDEVAKEEEVDYSKIPNAIPTYTLAHVRPIIDLDEVLKIFKNTTDSQNILEYANKPPLTFFFEQPDHSQRTPNEIESQPKSAPKIQLSSEISSQEDYDGNFLDNNFGLDSKPPLFYDPKKDITPIQDLDPSSEEFDSLNEKIIATDRFDKTEEEKIKITKTKPIKAIDYLKEIQRKTIQPSTNKLKNRLMFDSASMDPLTPVIKLDSKGFRNYETQVPNWNKCRQIDVVNYLKKNIIYHNYEVLAINKPYGLPSHVEAAEKGSYNVESLMQIVATEMGITKLYLAHRLDKTTTGVLLFATTPEQASNLGKLFRDNQIKKTYWCITKGIPNPVAGIVDIPIGEYKVAGKTRSCLVVEDTDPSKQLAKKYKEARRAITEYKIIEQQKFAALVEVKPYSGVKHQIRCHLSFALGTPILGDHKYSYIDRIAPQKLAIPLLNQLSLRQEKVRTLPIHLHSKSMMIPQVKPNSLNLFINAALPKHFVENMRAIKLSKAQ